MHWNHCDDSFIIKIKYKQKLETFPWELTEIKQGEDVIRCKIFSSIRDKRKKKEKCFFGTTLSKISLSKKKKWQVSVLLGTEKM